MPSVVLESKLAKYRWWTNHGLWLILCIGIHYLRISVKFSHFRDLTDGTTCTFRDFFWCLTHFYHKICLFTEHCSTCFFHLLYTFYSRLLNLVREVGYSPLWNLRVLCGCWSCWGGMTCNSSWKTHANWKIQLGNAGHWKIKAVYQKQICGSSKKGKKYDFGPG